MGSRIPKRIPEEDRLLRLTEITYHVHEVEPELVSHYISRAQQLFTRYAYGLSRGENVHDIAMNLDLICSWGLNYEPAFMECMGISKVEIKALVREEHLKHCKHCLAECRKNPNSPLAAELWRSEAWELTLEEIGTTQEECYTFTNYLQTGVPWGKG